MSKICVKCNVAKEKDDFTSTQYKRATRTCKACCPAGAVEAVNAVTEKIKLQHEQEASERARAAAAAKCEMDRHKQKANAEHAGVPLPPEVERKRGKDVREKEVKAARKANSHDGF